MAPLTSTQLLVLSLPAIAVLLNYFWFKKKRIGAPSDPGDKETAARTDASVEIGKSSSIPLDIEPQRNCTATNIEESFSVPIEKISEKEGTPNKSFSRSLSAPIPIVLPKELRLTKTLNISDEELEQQIEKLKLSVKKTDPFEQWKASCSVSPSFKGIYSIPSGTASVKENKSATTFGNILNNNQEVKKSVDARKIEEITAIIDQLLEIPHQDNHNTILTPGKVRFLEHEIQLNTSSAKEESAIELVSEPEIQKEIETSNNTLTKIDSSCEDMTSTSNKDILDSQCKTNIEEMTSADEKDLVPEPALATVENNDAFVCADGKDTVSQSNENVQEITSALQDLTAVDDLDNAPEKRLSSTEEPNSVEEVPSEGGPSSLEERSNDAEPTSAASTGAIPKKNKKKKFRKLDCDLKDLGRKLRDTKNRPKTVMPEKKKDGQKSRNDSGCEREEVVAHSSGRASATESPAETMLAACGSLNSLSSLEGSNDSGKGCSDVITPPPQNEPPVPEPDTISFYEFLLHKSLVGKLIGKRGSFVNLIYTKTSAHLIVKGHPYDDEQKVCIVEGTVDSIKKAMKMVKQRFPKEKLKAFLPEDHIPPHMRVENFLLLPSGLNLETHVSWMHTPSHLYLQQPGHPTYPNFLLMHSQINMLYNTDEVPLVPKPAENIMCVAFVFESWSRVLVLSVNEETEMAYVKCVDFGGFGHVHFSNMKQIRQDIFCLPFQAAECFLANIEPIGDEWSQEAFKLMSDLIRVSIVYTHVVALTEENIPLVNCQVIRDMKPIWINEQLVKQGHAKWINEIPQLEVEGATAEEEC